MTIQHQKIRFVESKEDNNIEEIPTNTIPNFGGVVSLDGKEVGWVSCIADASGKGLSLDATKHEWRIVAHPSNPYRVLLIAQRKKE